MIANSVLTLSFTPHVSVVNVFLSFSCVLPKGGPGGCCVGGALGQSHPCHVTVRGRQ